MNDGKSPLEGLTLKNGGESRIGKKADEKPTEKVKCTRYLDDYDKGSGKQATGPGSALDTVALLSADQTTSKMARYSNTKASGYNEIISTTGVRWTPTLSSTNRVTPNANPPRSADKPNFRRKLDDRKWLLYASGRSCVTHEDSCDASLQISYVDSCACKPSRSQRRSENSWSHWALCSGIFSRQLRFVTLAVCSRKHVRSPCRASSSHCYSIGFYPTVIDQPLPQWRLGGKEDLKLRFSWAESNLRAGMRCLSCVQLRDMFMNSSQHLRLPFSCYSNVDF